MPYTIGQVANACEVGKKTIRSLLEQAARIPVSCSYRIFNSRVSLDSRETLELKTSELKELELKSSELELKSLVWANSIDLPKLNFSA